MNEVCLGKSRGAGIPGHHSNAVKYFAGKKKPTHLSRLLHITIYILSLFFSCFQEITFRLENFIKQPCFCPAEFSSLVDR